MSRSIHTGAKDQTIYVMLVSDVNGAPKTALAYNSAGAKCYYVRDRQAPAAITLVDLASATAAHADGGFKEVDAATVAGLYRLDLPDAVFAAGARSARVLLAFDGAVPAVKELDFAAASDARLAKAALTHTRMHTVATGVDIITDDDGETPLLTLTPSEADGVVTVTAS